MLNSKFPTPHINSFPGHIAKTVLMPGDPLRAEFVAKNFLDSPTLFNNVRGVNGYTGTYNGTRISVMASGMGMPSMGIYSYELFNFFGVDNIIRIGSAGAISEKLKLRDLVIGMGACTNSNYAAQYHLPGVFAPIADYSLLSSAKRISDEMNLPAHIGNIISTDTFYNDYDEDSLAWSKMGVLAVEMEAAALYMNAARAGKRALAICTISDSLLTGEFLSSSERSTSFTDMIAVALKLAVEISNE